MYSMFRWLIKETLFKLPQTPITSALRDYSTCSDSQMIEITEPVIQLNLKVVKMHIEKFMPAFAIDSDLSPNVFRHICSSMPRSFTRDKASHQYSAVSGKLLFNAYRLADSEKVHVLMNF